MSRYAIVEHGVVTNVVLWDGKTECDAIPVDSVELTEESVVGAGYTFDGASFVAPPVPELPEFPVQS